MVLTLSTSYVEIDAPLIVYLHQLLCFPEKEQEQERRAQEKERRVQEKEQEQERRAQEKERRAQEKERRDQEKETPQETEGEETPSEERYNASHDPGGSWLTKEKEQEQERRAQEKERRVQEKEQEQERRAQEKERRAQEKERRDQEKETPQETEGEETPSEERYNASHDPGGSWLTKIPPEGTARRLPGKEPLQLYQLDRHYRNCTATPKENPDT
ncbi:hypothetical protein NDU88_004868 [Pleurodeles waltl]|uniref:Uncharacterized protein n=1 Tax=Pleurodeles waltl TaxID=8319 RepID=A0AAV7NNJ8_PLEWA|nr:hypothetical protein NDU88_004868 [Pleurodeles waltl]